MNDIKKRLREYKFIVARKRELEIRVQELTNGIGPSGLSYEDKGGRTNKINSSVEDEAIKLADLKQLINELGLEIERIENALNMLNDRERQAIELKYIEDYSLETIIYKMDRQKRTVLYFIGDGLKKIDKILNS